MKNVILNKALHNLLIFFCAALLSVSCSSEKRETLTSGKLTMITSEDLFPVIDIQVKDFQRVYEEVKINNLSLSTREAMVQLLNDSISLIVCARPLNGEEQTVAAENDYTIDSIRIAYDGIAVIVNKKNAVEQLTTNDLRNILIGNTKRWTSYMKSGLSSAIVIAMGDPNSGVHEYLKTRLIENNQYSSNVFPCSNTPEVFALVQDRPNAIGFVSTAWLSKLPADLHAVEIGDRNIQRDSTSTTMEYFQPHQAYIYQKLYPLFREIYIYSHNVGKGVGLGFTSFAASSDGQKIIVSNGLVPATMPVRLVHLQSP